jgi:flavin reductase (DIM6/NTAB) family NADH-FMN oxidoreductase RutF
VTLEVAFGAVMASLDHPMLIVTVAAAGKRAGCLVGFASQCSIHPPRLVVWLSKRNRTHEVAGRARHLGVHVVPADRLELARLFGSETGDEVDKFSRCAWDPSPGGVPLLRDCPTRVTGRIADRADWGDHEGFLLDPVAAEHGDDDRPALRLHQARHLDPGHEP